MDVRQPVAIDLKETKEHTIWIMTTYQALELLMNTMEDLRRSTGRLPMLISQQRVIRTYSETSKENILLAEPSKVV